MNDAKQPILLVEGEELKGAKQNRIVNASFLIAGKTATTIPVSCVEEQRWHYDSKNFHQVKRSCMHRCAGRYRIVCGIVYLAVPAIAPIKVRYGITSLKKSVKRLFKL